MNSAIVVVSDEELNALDWAWLYVSKVLDVQGQVTILILMLGLLAFTIYLTRKDEYLWLQMKSLMSSSMGLIILIAILMYISPLVLPEKDPFSLYRVVVLRSTSFFVGLLCITCAILFVSKVLFPEGLFKQITSVPYGPTAVLCSIIIGLIYLATYS